MKNTKSFENVLVHVVMYKETVDGEWKTGIRVGEDGYTIVNIDGKTVPEQIYDIRSSLSDGCFVIQREREQPKEEKPKCPYTKDDVYYLKRYMNFDTVEEGEIKLAEANGLRNTLVGNTVYADAVEHDIDIIEKKIAWLKNS